MKRPYPWKCHTCRERQVFPVTVDYVTELEHDGRVYSVTVNNLEILRCRACGAQVLPDEAHARLAEELRHQAGLLQPGEIAAKRELLRLSQKDFAHLLGVAPATVCRWEGGGQIQQRVMNDLMNAFFDLPELRAYLRGLRGLCSEAPDAVAPTVHADNPPTPGPVPAAGPPGEVEAGS